MGKKKYTPNGETCYEFSTCDNAGNKDKCIECERNWDNFPEYNDNYVLKATNANQESTNHSK